MNKEQIKKLFETRNENKNIDFKESFKFSKSENPKETMCLIKDILAFSNTQDGGNIIIGVKDDDFSIQGVEEEHLSSFDQTKLNQLLEQYTSPNHYCNVRKSKIEDKNIVIISIPEYDEMSNIISKSRRTIIRNMKKLKEKNIVKRIGSDKSGHWEIIN